MNDAEAESIKKRIQAILARWRPSGFAWWRIRTVYDRGCHADCDTRARVAQTQMRWEYREATITFYLDRFEKLGDEESEAAVVHELSHLLVSPIEDASSDLARQVTEHAVELVASALLWTRDWASAGTRTRKHSKRQAKRRPNKRKSKNQP